jgi:elongation factor G
VGPPQIAYRATVGASASVDYSHKQHAYGAAEYARVVLGVEPASAQLDAFRNNAVNEPRQACLDGVRQGVEAGLLAGVIGGFPVMNVAVVLKDCAFHETDSSQRAFQIASLAALREALRKAEPLLLEPIMKVVIETPRDFAEAIVGDLRSRRGVIRQQADVPPADMRIVTLVPAANLQGYASTLRQISRRRASYDVNFDHYAPVPPDPPFRSALRMRA